MRNVTITLPEEVARWARVWAAKHDTSVSRMLGDLLRQHMEQEQRFDAARRSFYSRGPGKLKRGRARYPRREDLHER